MIDMNVARESAEAIWEDTLNRPGWRVLCENVSASEKLSIIEDWTSIIMTKLAEAEAKRERR